MSNCGFWFDFLYSSLVGVYSFGVGWKLEEDVVDVVVEVTKQ